MSDSRDMIRDVQSKSDSQRLLARSRGGVHYSRFLSMSFNHVCVCVCACGAGELVNEEGAKKKYSQSAIVL